MKKYSDMPQWERVVTYLQKHGSITQKEADKHLAVSRLPSRIWDLTHKKGYKIVKKSEAVKNRWGQKCYIVRYYMGSVGDG